MKKSGHMDNWIYQINVNSDGPYTYINALKSQIIIPNQNKHTVPGPHQDFIIAGAEC